VDERGKGAGQERVSDGSPGVRVRSRRPVEDALRQTAVLVLMVAVCVGVVTVTSSV